MRLRQRMGLFEQETDVLDTWFSSALWPISTLGWPDETPELKKFYPTSALVTSRDIITLWVARMVLAGLYNVDEMPFHEVYITPKILDGYGETMSKSKGNGVDPLDVIEKFGADALRFGIAYLTTDTQDVKLPVEFECPHCQAQFAQTKKNRMLPRIECEKCGKPFSTQWAEKPEDKALPRGAVVSERFELGRNFANKLWNAARFSLINLEGYTPGAGRRQGLAARRPLAALATGDRDAANDRCTRTLPLCRCGPHAVRLRLERVLQLLRGDDESPVCGGRAAANGAARVGACARCAAAAVASDDAVSHGRSLAVVGAGGAEPRPSGSGYEQDDALRKAFALRLALGRHGAAGCAIEQQFADFQAVLGAVREIRQSQNIPQGRIAFTVRCDGATADLLQPMQPYFTQMAHATATALGTRRDRARCRGQSNDSLASRARSRSMSM